MPQKPEQVVAKKIIADLRKAGWECIRLQAGLVRGFTGGLFQMTKAGTPDWVALRPVTWEAPANIGFGRMMFIETKAPKKKLRASQVERILELQKNGFLVVVTSSHELFRQWYINTIGEDPWKKN